MAQFVTHIQPTLVESSHGHHPHAGHPHHHHKESGHYHKEKEGASSQHRKESPGGDSTGHGSHGHHHHKEKKTAMKTHEEEHETPAKKIQPPTSIDLNPVHRENKPVSFFCCYVFLSVIDLRLCFWSGCKKILGTASARVLFPNSNVYIKVLLYCFPIFKP